MTDVDRPRVASSQSLPSRWREVLRTSNPPQGKLDAVSRWLVLTRASQCRGQSVQSAGPAQFPFQRGKSVSEKFIVFRECVLNYNQVEGAEPAE